MNPQCLGRHLAVKGELVYMGKGKQAPKEKPKVREMELEERRDI